MQLGKAVETRNSRIVDIWLGKKRSLEGLSIFFSFKGKKKKEKGNFYVEKEFVWKPCYKCQNRERTAYSLNRKVLQENDTLAIKLFRSYLNTLPFWGEW